jgi:hypothetical protein
VVSIFADEDSNENLDGNNNDIVHERDEEKGIEDSNQSISELISHILEICCEILKIIQSYSIEYIDINHDIIRDNFSQIYVDIMRKEGIELDIIIEKQKRKDTELKKILDIENIISIKIKKNVDILFHYRNILFLKLKDIVYDDNQEDAIALLMFFNQS